MVSIRKSIGVSQNSQQRGKSSHLVLMAVVPIKGLSGNFLFDPENDTIVHPSRLFATL
jgi:hypothetical protein